MILASWDGCPLCFICHSIEPAQCRLVPLPVSFVVLWHIKCASLLRLSRISRQRPLPSVLRRCNPAPLFANGQLSHIFSVRHFIARPSACPAILCTGR